ncbi:MAG: ABC transporter substrate-binding protein [Eubacteriales bacterium]
MKTKIIIPSIIVIICLFLFIGCNPSTHVDSTSQDTEIQIVDHLGHEVILSKPAERVVTTFRPITYFIYAIGGQEKLVGVDSNSTTCPMLLNVYPEIEELPMVGSKNSGYNIETIISVNPDLVVLHSGDGMDVIAQQLDEQKIPYITVIPETLEDMKDTAVILGKALGTTEQVDELLDFYDDTLNMIAERTKDIPDSDKKHVYMTGSDLFKTCTKDLYQNHLIEAAGGINVSGDLTGYFPVVSAEQIIAWNPDVLFSIYHNFDGSVDSIMKNEQIQSINAIKNNQVYKIPSFLGGWDYPEPRSALGALFIAKTLYPERFEDVDLLEVANQFHTKFYGKSYEYLGGTEDEILGKGHLEDGVSTGSTCPNKQ